VVTRILGFAALTAMWPPGLFLPACQQFYRLPYAGTNSLRGPWIVPGKVGLNLFKIGDARSV